MKTNKKLSFLPLAPKTWNDFEELFGKRGACGGCWCMYWRMKRSDFNREKGAGTRKLMQKLVAQGLCPGILAFQGETAVGWCAVAPRREYTVLENSKILRPVDAEPVWSVVCFFVRRESRQQGITIALLQAAVDFARRQGGRIVEGYPVEPKKESIPAVFAYTGLASAFHQAGFKEVARRSETRPIMRYIIK